MDRRVLYVLLIFCMCPAFFFKAPLAGAEAVSKQEHQNLIKLQRPKYKSSVSIEEALFKRRSVRDYRRDTLTLGEVSQLLWAAQGVTNERGFRTAPSAGALYPLEVYIVIGDVVGLEKGIYKYGPGEHTLESMLSGDKRSELAAACFGQTWVRDCPVIIVFSAVYERTTRKYSTRGIRYVNMEAGHAAQNVSLQAISLNLGTVMVGAFDDSRIKKIMSLPENEEPLYLIPVGRVS